MIRSKIYRALLKEVNSSRLSPPNRLNKELISREKGRLDLFMGRKSKVKSVIARPLRPIAESRVVEDAGQTLSYREKKEQWRKQAVKNNPKGIAANEEWKKKNNIKDVQADPNAENVSRLKPMNTDHKPLPKSPSPVAAAKVSGTTQGNSPLSRLKKLSKFSGLKVETKGRMRGSSVMRTAARSIPIKIRASETPFILFRLLEGPAAKAATKGASKASPKKSPAKSAVKPAANKLPGKAAVMPTMQPPAPPQPNPNASPGVKLLHKKTKKPVQEGKINEKPEAKKPAIKLEKLMSESGLLEAPKLNLGVTSKVAGKMNVPPDKFISYGKLATGFVGEPQRGKALNWHSPARDFVQSGRRADELKRDIRRAKARTRLNKSRADKGMAPFEESAAKEKVEMNKKEFKKEHKHLFRVLKGGKKKELKKELHKQKKEFKEEVKESGNPVNKMAAKAVKVWQGGGIPMSSKVGKAAIDFKMGKQSRRNKRNKYPKDNYYNSNQ